MVAARQTLPRQAGEAGGLLDEGTARPDHDEESSGCGSQFHLQLVVAGAAEADESLDAREQPADREKADTVHGAVHCIGPGRAWAAGDWVRRKHWGLDRAADCSSCRSCHADMLGVGRKRGIG